MTDYKACRQHMVESQLEPNGIIDQGIIEAFQSIPRERFVSEDMAGICHVDEDVHLGNGGAFLIEPVAHARLLQLADLKPTDSVLNIGDYTGYGSAILSTIVSTVITVEETEGHLEGAKDIWEDLNLNNIAVLQGKFTEGAPRHAPYPVIIMHGSVADVPPAILDQLDDQGRLITILRENESSVGQITVFKKMEGDHITSNSYFDTSTPYLCGFEPVQKFVFG